MSEAIYIAEFKSISYGIYVADKMLKSASITLLHADPICIGKYLIVVGGDVAEVHEAEKVASLPNKSFLSGELITGTHPSILNYFKHEQEKPLLPPSSIGIVECINVSSGFFTLDKALKTGNVDLLKIWMGRFIGGKMCYVLGGQISDVDAATKIVEQQLKPPTLVGIEQIPNPDSIILSQFYK